MGVRKTPSAARMGPIATVMAAVRDMDIRSQARSDDKSTGRDPNARHIVECPFRVCVGEGSG
jgi:hypothetical protein